MNIGKFMNSLRKYEKDFGWKIIANVKYGTYRYSIYQLMFGGHLALIHTKKLVKWKPPNMYYEWDEIYSKRLDVTEIRKNL